MQIKKQRIKQKPLLFCFYEKKIYILIINLEIYSNVE